MRQSFRSFLLILAVVSATGTALSAESLKPQTTCPDMGGPSEDRTVVFISNHNTASSAPVMASPSKSATTGRSARCGKLNCALPYTASSPLVYRLS